MKSTCETLQQQLNGWPLADPSSHHLFIPMATGSDNFRQTAPSLSVGFLNICMEGNIHSLAFFFLYTRRSATIPSLCGTIPVRQFVALYFSTKTWGLVGKTNTTQEETRRSPFLDQV
jgi:hypothetical protein